METNNYQASPRESSFTSDLSFQDGTSAIDCTVRDVEKLINTPEWKPWAKSSIIKTLSGYKEGWYQNREQSLPVYLVTELLLGLVVVFAQVAETISFSLMAKVDPSFGLHGAWIIGLISTLFGGRGGMVYGVTGSVSSITGAMILSTGRADYVFPVIITAGIMLILFSLLNLGWVVRFISKNVMIGFCNGLAIIIGMSQLHMFKNADHEYVTGEIAVHMVIMCFCSMLIFNFWGRIPVVGNYIPSAFSALVFSGLYEVLIVYLWRDVRTVSIGDVGALDPQFRFPRPFWHLPTVGQFDWSDIGIIMNKALSFFLVMCLESLMTLNVMDLHYEQKSDPNQSLLAIGVSNVVSGLFGGIGGNTMIGLCGLLSRSGGCGKEASIVTAVLMFVTVSVLSPYLNFFPTAGLAGIMFIVVVHTFSWDSLTMVICSLFPKKLVHKYEKLQRRIPRSDAFILLLVSILVPVYGLDVGILAGMILSALSFAESSYRQVQVYKHFADRSDLGNVAVYDIVGPLFFSSSEAVQDAFDYANDPQYVIVRMNNTHIQDYSAMETLSQAKSNYEAIGKVMIVKHLTKKCEDKINLSHARLDWDKAHYDNYEVDIPRLEKFTDELPCMPIMPKNAFTSDHFSGRFRDNSTNQTMEILPSVTTAAPTLDICTEALAQKEAV